jgi:hypothetical protein
MEKVPFLLLDFWGKGIAARYLFESEEIKDNVGGQFGTVIKLVLIDCAINAHYDDYMQ